MPALYGCETHMLMVAEIVIGDHFCTSPAYVLRAEYWVVDWARPTSLKGVLEIYDPDARRIVCAFCSGVQPRVSDGLREWLRIRPCVVQPESQMLQHHATQHHHNNTNFSLTAIERVHPNVTESVTFLP
jgi:hypothetical protein